MPRRDVDDFFWQVGSELQRLTEEMTRSRPGVAAHRCWEPRVDVLEDARRVIVRADIAGVRGDEIQLLYVPERHSLLIRGVRQEDDLGSDSRMTVHQLEILHGEFQREVKLPDVSLRPDEIRAQYRNGFLFVMIPKQERVVKSRTVTVIS